MTRKPEKRTEGAVQAIIEQGKFHRHVGAREFALVHACNDSVAELVAKIPAPLKCHRVESRGPSAENKWVPEGTFMKFRGPQALTDSVGRGTTVCVLTGSRIFL